ncbi:flagellar filament capping protein FliD [Chitinibacter sp. GC72]|uniref:flagellar filament capping protein FliD n=1 Tax=Chitinibacter sp. GC72 TaxID=1526917 RepID=UPI0012FAF0D6|nr:flagellar filament capping protein FliD [Chitinibacter sp. GC72]
MASIDVNSIVSQLMEVERQPLKKFDVRNIGIQARISAYGSIKSALSSFQGAAQKLSNADNFNVINATSSATDFVSISATKNAADSKFSMEVTQLAQNQKLASTAFTSTTAEVGLGTIKLDFGKYITAAGTTSFTSNPEKVSKSITIDANNNTLAGVRDAINNAKAGVTASIINDGSGYKLTIVSNDTGESNALKITTTDTGDGVDSDAAGLSRLAYNASTGGAANLTQNQAAQNARFKVDGIDISKAANVVSDVIDGVTLTLNKVTTSAVNLSVGKNTSGIAKNVQDFIKAYNDLSKALTDSTAYNKDTKQGAILNGEGTVRSIQVSLRNAINQTIAGTGGDFKSLTQIGIKLDQNGVMSLDTAKFNAAIEKDAQGVISLFASNGRASDSLIRIDSFDKNTQTVADLGVSVVSNATQASYTTTALSFSGPGGTFNIGASNKNFGITVNGAVASITLTEGDYTPSQLAAELQTRINSNSVLQTAGAKVGVVIGADNKIVINNTKFGSEGMLSVTSDLLGTGTSGPITGSDVQVKVGNDLKTGVGQQVTLDSGLKFSVLGGAASSPDGASRGTISFSRGFGFQFDSMLEKMLSNKGEVATRIDGMNREAKNIAKRTEEFNRRLVDIEQRYRKQYTALDLAVTQMQSTSTWLTTQLANLPKVA